MIIKAGNQTIEATTIYQERRTIDDAPRDTLRIALSRGITPEQLAAMQEHTLDIDDGYQTFDGYSLVHEHYLVLAKGPDGLLQQARADAALAQAQATQAAQEAAQAQEQAEAKTALLLTVAEALPDEVAVKHPEIYPELKRDGSAVAADTRIRWGDKVAKAKVTLWDREDQDPDHAPNLWDILTFGGSGYREIPETITTELAFSEGEIGYWPPDGKHYRAVRNGVVHNPEVYPRDWEEVEV